MREKIYTLPINEAFDKACACPLCNIENKLNMEEVEYTLGAAMMEPDFRIVTNKKGFCKVHFSQLVTQNKSLPLALIMQSQSETQNKLIASVPQTSSKKLFGKSSMKQSAIKCADVINHFVTSCAICEKIEHTMDKFCENIIFMWKTEPSFKEKFNERSFCLPHFSKLVQYGTKGLGESDFEEFYKVILESQTKSLDEMYADVSEFTKLFDHRTSGTPTEKVKTALKRCIHMYSGFTSEND